MSHAQPIRIPIRPRSGRTLRCCLIGLLLCFSISAFAAEPLKVIFGVSRPPFVMEESQNGISIDLFREATRRMGLDFRPSFAPNLRLQYELERGTFDAVVEVQSSTDKAFYSTPFVTYSNVVLSRTTENLKFRDWPDLAGKDVCAWQNAESNLGPAFSAAKSDFSSYHEFGVQRNQVRLWILKRCQVLVIDRNLVIWHMMELSRSDPKLKVPSENELVMAPVPGKSNLDWYVGFRDENLRNRFNEALDAMRRDGTYKRIFDKYIRGKPF